MRDFGNWDRKGPLTPTLPNGPPARSNDRPVSHDGPRDRRNSPAWGEGRSQEGSRPPRREFVDRPVIDRAPTAPELDNQWRTKMRPDAPNVPTIAPTRSPALSSREISAPPSPASAQQAPHTRPKLNLAKRTLTESEPPATSTTSTDSKASPFGAAKPVDTAAKEKEVEEKRQIALREKKEADDKAREEKRVAEDKVREEKRLAREVEKTEKAEKASSFKEKSNGQEPDKENGTAIPGKNYEILRRTTTENIITGDEEAAEEGENGIIVEDKAVKPKNIVRDASPKKPEGGNLTNGTSSPQVGTAADSTAEALEDDGWSTVSKPRNNRRNGNQAARAIAS